MDETVIMIRHTFFWGRESSFFMLVFSIFSLQVSSSSFLVTAVLFSSSSNFEVGVCGGKKM